MQIHLRCGQTGAIGVALALVLPFAAGAQTDDTALFSVAVPPNVLLLVDNSGSMNHVVWHPDFDPTAGSACNFFSDDTQYNVNSWSTDSNGPSSSGDTYFAPGTFSVCGNTREIFIDPAVQADGNSTRWLGRYLNWYFSDAADGVAADITASNNGSYSACVQAQFGIGQFNRYRRSRVTASKDVLKEVICNVNLAAEVRFGLAQYRLSGWSGDPNGGFVVVPIEDFDAPSYSLNGSANKAHLDHLSDAIEALEGESWTPLAESLFQLYTYFMSRDAADRPTGVGGGTFPGYVYRTDKSGNYGNPGSSAQVPEDPVLYECQKHFVIIITDGEPTKDDFDNSNSSDNTAQGFSSFGSLIGDYHADGETEVNPSWQQSGWESTQYLDDIAKFMQDTDFRPDLDGNQTIDVYTVGFTTSPFANAILQKTADVGNGLFYFSNSAEELAEAIVGSVTDIVQKSQSFTAATVPATRTAEGGNFFTSLFIPANDSPFWEGHLRLFHFTADGDILDANGQCALLDPSPPGQCKSGPFNPSAEPYWDAGEEIPSPSSRNLLTSVPGSGMVDFDASLGVTELGDTTTAADDLTLGDAAQYPGSNATTAEELADEIIQNVRGCEFGTGVTNACVERPWLLSDIFHSNPIIVGRPRGFLLDASYVAFKNDPAIQFRDKMVYAGANGGFLHAFLAGEFHSSPAPAGYDRGTGEEVFGFMPWPSRQQIRQLPKDSGNRDYYFVDGSPAAADVWLYSNATQVVKNPSGSEWRTVLLGGLRQGGGAYYALDVTDPADPGYPGYLWEFPAEDAPASLRDYFGETWGQPIITKVKVVIAGVPYERWIAVVTGGYDPSGDPNDPVNYDPNAKAGRGIFIIDIKTGEVLGRKAFDPIALGPESQMQYAMAATPAVFDRDGDGYADVIYVPDLGGNVWKWVIKHDPLFGNFLTDPINSVGVVGQPTTHFGKFFEAKATPASPLAVTLTNDDGVDVDYYKSFFFPPAGTLKSGEMWLAFASGERANLRRLHDLDSDADNNRFYSLRDLDPYERSAVPNPTLTEADLYDATNDGTCADLSAYRGYLFKAREHEKFVTNIEIFAFQVIAASFLPDETGDRCTAGGTAALYIFRVYCGEGYFPGSGGETRRLELGDGMPTDPRVSVSPEGTRVIVTQQDGEVENPPGPPPPNGGLGQLYWREVNN